MESSIYAEASPFESNTKIQCFILLFLLLLMTNWIRFHLKNCRSIPRGSAVTENVRVTKSYKFFRVELCSDKWTCKNFKGVKKILHQPKRTPKIIFVFWETVAIKLSALLKQPHFAPLRWHRNSSKIWKNVRVMGSISRPNFNADGFRDYLLEPNLVACHSL